MVDIPKLCNAGQLSKMLILGRFLVPVLGIIPACAPFFVVFPQDAPVVNPAFRIGVVAVAFATSWAIVWYVKKTYPKEIWLGDEVELHYLKKTITRPYSDIEQVKLDNRQGSFRGGGAFALNVEETMFILGFRGGPIVNISVVPAKQKPFFDELQRRLQIENGASADGSSISPEQLSYTIAYSVLPHFVFQDFDQFKAMFKAGPEMACRYLLTVASQAMEVKSPDAHWQQYHCHFGTFIAQEYLAIEYPLPRPIELSGEDPMKMLRERNSIVLAPYFSVVLLSTSAAPRYFVLGQAPMGGGTTVREVTSQGVNANLGPGPTPKLDLFLDAIGQRLNAKTNPS